LQDKELIKYKLIVNSAKLITKDWEDLAHDVYLKLIDKDLSEFTNSEKASYIYVTVRNTFYNQQDLLAIRNTIYLPEFDSIQDEEDEQDRDPYQMLKELRVSNKIDEIEKLWIETYLDHKSYLEIERNINVCRQTVKKRIKEIIWKLSQD